MVLISSILLFGILTSSVLGVVVYYTNNKRKANQASLIALMLVALWLLINLFILHSKTELHALIYLNLAAALSACIPSAFHLLRLAIIHPSDSWKNLLKRNALQLILNSIVIGLCFLPSFTKSVHFPEAGQISLAQPDYGAPFFFFVFYLIISIGSLGYHLFHDRKPLQGMQRIELEFLGFACLSGSIIAILGAIFVAITKSSSLAPITNSACVLTISFIVAYGIATKHILNVGTVIRKTVSYALLNIYLVSLYLIVWITSKYILSGIIADPGFPSHLLAALIVAFSMTPAHGKLQDFADKMISIQAVDIPLLMKHAGLIFQSVTTSDALVQQFSNLLRSELGTNDVRIDLSPTTNTLDRDSINDKSEHGPLSNDSAVINILQETKEPVSHDRLVRARQNNLNRAAVSELKALNSDLAVGFFQKTGKNGIVLFGSRKGGRIYDKAEQDALQILCNQFAVALENAQMYTEMQDSKIRNEIMLDQLVSGVILANTNHRITLFNHEAQKLTGIRDQDAIGMDIDVLPKPIAMALDNALRREVGERNMEARLYEQEEKRKSLHLRMGTTFLLGHDQKPMGALLVFTDMTELKSLEEQVRRSDQLSSVGTLAAGMAHEIKNPLVTIKTFTQLLPNRYADEDFRKDFSSLVAHEVSRIDSIVNELLSFSKPTKPHLVPMHLHETVDQMLKLTHEQMVQKEITVKDRCEAKIDLIQGDAKLLSQAFINLTLNAIEAIGLKGTITIGTSNCKYRFANGDKPHRSVTKNCIRIQISDTGQGIPRESLQKIFDPFFTSKSEGTGMGLSVAHGIINEHHGVIDVESEIGKGTTFYLYIPVLDKVVT